MGAADRRRAARDNAAQRRAYLAAAQITYWHGGYPGLSVGQVLRPPRDIPGAAEYLREQIASMQGTSYGEHPGEFDRVYVTTDRQLARAFAHKMRNQLGESVGALYRVQPVGPLEPDPDYEDVVPGLSSSCPVARIEEVEEDPVVMTLLEERAAAGKYQTWKTGGPMYDADGWILPNDGLRAFGLTEADTRALWAPWTPWQEFIVEDERVSRYLAEKRQRATS
ncbi:hypothetical protein [Clavibacter michiganensis]|uniref:hypothetical protein n=1 Tax=Clavibacter michiganensis TaxID=28447 RepID=UPI0013658F30|nr:hypothetical protein [Clavibacter michiganensis]